MGAFLVVSCTDDEAVVLEPYLPAAERIASVPVYGGTLESAPGIGGLVAADPEGDRLLRVVGDEITDLDLGDNARPFRVYVEDTRAWVTLRGTGELVSIALETMTVTWRTRVCLEPRGVTRSPVGPLVVACAGGELVEIDDDGNIVRLVVLDSDLRDVVAGTLAMRVLWEGGSLAPGDDVLRVSRFATAEILLVDPDTLTLLTHSSLGEGATAAWRMRDDNGEVFVLQQRAATAPISLSGSSDEYYSSNGSTNNPCGTIVETVISSVAGVAPLALVNVGTDFVVAADGAIAVTSAGAGDGHPGVLSFVLDPDPDAWRGDVCHFPIQERVLRTDGRAAALAFDVDGTLVVQSAAPLSLARAEEGGVILAEPAGPSADVQRLFHSNPSPAPGVSCASCHPEGHDDGHVWTFIGDSSMLYRRTMPLAGEISARSPYHWDAALDGAAALMAETFVTGMGGTEPAPEESTALFEWLNGLRHVRAHPGTDESVIEIGRTAFAKAGCAACHAGAAFTHNTVEFVGRETEAVKTPSLLGVGIRNDLLHDGCAYDLDARFRSCLQSSFGADSHGRVSVLTTDELEALKAYLRTL